MHGTYMIGPFWTRINGYEDRGICATCNTTESMDHILTRCREQSTHLIWSLARNLWPHRNTPWPMIDLGTILGCGSITLHAENRPGHARERNESSILKGPTRLLQIILSESAYLIWVLRCERAIQGKIHSETEIRERWLHEINERLTTDKIMATKIKRDNGFTTLVVKTWEQALQKQRGLPLNWINISEVLVGRTA